MHSSKHRCRQRACLVRRWWLVGHMSSGVALTSYQRWPLCKHHHSIKAVSCYISSPVVSETRQDVGHSQLCGTEARYAIAGEGASVGEH